MRGKELEKRQSSSLATGRQSAAQMSSRQTVQRKRASSFGSGISWAGVGSEGEIADGRRRFCKLRGAVPSAGSRAATETVPEIAGCRIDGRR